MGGRRLGTAGWSIPRAVAGEFPAEGAGLERYAARFNAVEINTSFYRPHRRETYERWARNTPPHFRFSVKVPRAVTHHAKLAGCDPLMARFLSEAAGLGAKLGPILVQLPPSLAFDPAVATDFFAALRTRFSGAVVCEPRHPTWFGVAADELLQANHVGRVAADPAPHPEAARPGGWAATSYWRLHGSPRMYYSAYEDAVLRALARAMLRRDESSDSWCIFDNTASGAAVADALKLSALLPVSPEPADG
ncbi:DUF72 domain-containing protein [Phenylobacterium sp.]|uniref:DUF72 domain-containing protein n=1 Tax=Phenylobacterium sp. TaxID=1871053 RepID=UPI00301CFC31